MCEFKINVENGRAQIFTPYNAEFVSAIKNSVGGRKWDAEKRCWTVPETAIDSVREIMMNVYGRTDIPASAETVDVRVTVGEYGLRSDVRTGITLFGKAICSAFGRDSGARVSEDVTFVNGAPESAGSVKNWYTYIPENSVFTIADVVKAMIKEDDDYKVEIIEKKNEKADLLAEKERLLARIAEIESRLAELN